MVAEVSTFEDVKISALVRVSWTVAEKGVEDCDKLAISVLDCELVGCVLIVSAVPGWLVVLSVLDDVFSVDALAPVVDFSGEVLWVLVTVSVVDPSVVDDDSKVLSNEVLVSPVLFVLLFEVRLVFMVSSLKVVLSACTETSRMQINKVYNRRCILDPKYIHVQQYF